ncbi:exported hypothetical protein [Alteromonas alvinellae]
MKKQLKLITLLSVMVLAACQPKSQSYNHNSVMQMTDMSDRVEEVCINGFVYYSPIQGHGLAPKIVRAGFNTRGSVDYEECGYSYDFN